MSTRSSFITVTAILLASFTAYAQDGGQSSEALKIGTAALAAKQRAEVISAALAVIASMPQDDARTKALKAGLMNGLDSHSDLMMLYEKRIKELTASLNAPSLKAESPTEDKPMDPFATTPPSALALARAATQKADAKSGIYRNRVAVRVRINQVINPGKWLGYGTAVGAEEEYKEPIYIVGGPDTFVDGDPWSGYLYPCGTYSYSSAGGTTRTVRKYATSLDRAYSERPGQDE